MTINVRSNFPGGNAAGVHISARDGMPEIRFSPDPCGGAEALWFYLRLEEKDAQAPTDGKIRLTWTNIDNAYGGTAPAFCIPVTSSPGHTWMRMKQGEESRNEHGLRELSWLIPHPAPVTDIALCFPYGPDDLKANLDRARDFWQTAAIGITQGGRVMQRVYHDGGAGSHLPGVFALARQHAGETPGSWALDGFMRQWAQHKKGGYTVWTIPFADPDGVAWGWFGRENIPHDLGRAWGDLPSRHEAAIIQAELERWRQKCKPLLVLDLQATPVFDKDGVYAYADLENAEETKWCNVIKNVLKTDYAAEDFMRVDQRPSRNAGPTFVQWVRKTMGLPAISLHIPYAQANGQVLTQKNYREIGQRVMQAVIQRKG